MYHTPLTPLLVQSTCNNTPQLPRDDAHEEVKGVTDGCDESYATLHHTTRVARGLLLLSPTIRARTRDGTQTVGLNLLVVEPIDAANAPQGIGALKGHVDLIEIANL